MIKVKDLVFRGFAKEAGRVQISYLTEDLLMDPSHNLSTFLRLLEWFSEAQFLYPKVQGNDEVGKMFTSTRKTLILWNYTNKSFKDEINNMNKTRPTDFATFKAAKEAFLLAEERKNTNQLIKHTPSLTNLSPNLEVTKTRVSVAPAKNPEVTSPVLLVDIATKLAILASAASKIRNPKITKETRNLPRMK